MPSLPHGIIQRLSVLPLPYPETSKPSVHHGLINGLAHVGFPDHDESLYENALPSHIQDLIVLCFSYCSLTGEQSSENNKI
jgi:hypothetical protein